ncbi:MAG: DAK2 domain-containing protein, partial [Firmicutes bacterium]|nr:DAK2 domain-containing protein [Bacillota bacterium]
DAGGKGLLVLLEGIVVSLRDAAARRSVELFDLAVSQQKEFATSRAGEFTANIEFTYCTEFILTGERIPLDTLREELGPYGDCLLVVGDDRTAKVHIHSNHPGLVLECGLKYGALQRVQVNNMEEQHQGISRGAANAPKPFGVVAVAIGEGLKTILESLGVDAVVEGGQTMNPATEDLVQAINGINAEAVIILPNNGNILLAARQAVSLAGRPVAVVPTLSIPQGIAAMLSLNPYASLAENAAQMEEAMAAVKAGEVTRAVRDTEIDGLTVKKDDFIGLADGNLAAVSARLDETVEQLLTKMVDREASLITFYYGAGLSGAEAGAISALAQNKFAGLDIEVHYGGQPLYPFIISVE